MVEIFGHVSIIAYRDPFFQSMGRMMYLREMNLASLDLNLLVALDALVSEAHVGRAARRIGLSQPATSHALRRLRDIMGDPLLVRVGARMELTPRAIALRPPLAQALDQVRGLFVAESFDPASSTRRFALMMPDLVVDLVMPPLVERIGSAAPQIRLDVTPWQGSATMAAELAGSVDLVIACIGDAFPGFHRQHLYTDTDVLAVRSGHPLRARLRRLDAFLEAGHVAVIGPGQREDMIDGWLRDEGIERRIALAVPSYLQALRMAARTDLVAFVPSRLVAGFADPLSLAAVSPPVDPGIDEQFMFHPTRAHVDPASIWLRGLVAEIGRGLDRQKLRAA
jgi:DNA-binding transcriptional LysR family regulator